VIPRVLLTGFEPFGGSEKNPSQEVLDAISTQVRTSYFLETLLLPVEYQRSYKRLKEKVANMRPDIVISMGQAEGRSLVSLEKVAINLDDASLADNAGEVRTNLLIDESGPAAYFTNAPISLLYQDLLEAKLPVAISLTAGSFICNHISYQSLREIDLGKETRWFIFIHLPLLDSQSTKFPGKPTMSLAIQTGVIQKMLESLSNIWISEMSK
jgi:pyroglutamyl-peptidase